MPSSAFYTEAFYDDQSEGSLESAVQVVPLIVDLLRPASVVDIGCGVGTWLSVFMKGGIEDVIGIDGDYVKTSQLHIPQDRFVAKDLARPFKLDRTFDVAMSLEVAEHLPGSAAEDFIGSLVSLAPVVLFSAAMPGQGGTNHINEQWPEYWRNLFDSHDYCVIDILRPRVWLNDKIGPCYRQNMFLYIRKNALEKYSRVIEASNKGDTLPMSIIHPGVFKHALGRPLSLRRLLRALPNALSTTIRRRLPSLPK